VFQAQLLGHLRLPQLRVSLRSKGQVNVARFAEQFGGGGHARAAGLKLETDLATARQRVVEAMGTDDGVMENLRHRGGQNRYP
jgi:phosphoesterase RecJ-like protein